MQLTAQASLEQAQSIHTILDKAMERGHKRSGSGASAHDAREEIGFSFERADNEGRLNDGVVSPSAGSPCATSMVNLQGSPISLMTSVSELEVALFGEE